MIVVDATVWVDRLRGVLPERLGDEIKAAGCVSPAHVDFEVGSALIRLERRGDLASGHARVLVEAFIAHPVHRVRQPVDAVQALDMIDNATYADAWYIALAKRLGCRLVTTDSGMKKAARIHGVEVLDDQGV